MKTANTLLEYQMKEKFHFEDITDEVVKFVKESGIKNGLVNIQTMHTTAPLVLNENEPLLIEDIKQNLENTAPESLVYNHDNFEIRTVNMCDDECANGHSHCKAIRLPSSITLNLIEGKIQFGTWQRVLFFEMDRKRKRKVQIQVLGE